MKLCYDAVMLTFSSNCRRVPLLALALLATLAGCDGQHPFATDTPPEFSKKEEGLVALARAAERSGDMGRAVKLYTEAMEQSRGNIRAHLELADMYFRHGKTEDAQQVLAKAQALQTKDAALYQALGKLNIHKGKPKAALEAYEQGLAITPENISMLNGKGIALDSLSRHDEAAATYEQALGLTTKPEDELLLKNNLALSYIMSAQYAKAIAILEPIATREDSAVLRQNLALAYGLSGNMEQAREWAGKDLDGQKLQENIRFYRQYHDNRILQAISPLSKPKAP